jgi:DNA mismatch repair protein MutL
MNTFTEKTNPKIEILPEHIIDQIKAGEVLERPASLVKELVENSLDAGSTEINLHLIENGLDLLSVEDNGHGMTFENLPYAFLRHATSKLKTYEDLFSLHSFGFRGEALASVAASARLTCTTQPKDLSLEGGKIIIHGGAQELLIPNRSGQHGTSLFIKDLFYNTPARLKFIKSKVSEKSALKKMLYSFALANPSINFSFKWDEKEREIFKAEESLARAKHVFFPRNSKDAQGEVWSGTEEYDGYKVEIFFTPTTHSTPQYRHHYLFANNRFFQDKSLHSAILRTLETHWRFGESGHYVVKISVPPSDIDVNVHPNKTQIKFLKSDVIYSLLVSSIRNTVKKNAAPQPEMNFNSPAQSAFFSREENQNFDLQNMFNADDQNGETQAFQNSYQNHSQSFMLGQISAGIALLKLENSFFIADLKQLMASYLVESLEEFIQKEEVSGPLLISEPFRIPRGKIDQHLEDLKLLGFELDRLNPEVMALRTLPRFVPQAQSREITLCLIHYFEMPKTKVFEKADFKQYVISHWDSSSAISETLLEKILTRTRVGLVELTEQNVKGLLK